MAGVFIALLVLAYLVFLVDWKELRAILAAGGWGAAVVFAVVGVLVWAVLSSPAAIPPPMMH